MHDEGWLGMGGTGLYWLVPALLALVVIAAWMPLRRRSDGGR
jgi:hypothetical protein